MRYKVKINTESYKKMKSSEKNWEPGTINDFMEALNGWHTSENNLREVLWRIEMFRGVTWINSEYSEENKGMSDRYIKWMHKRCNTVKFHDHICGFDRTHIPSGYGFMQGYVSVSEKIEELKTSGKVRIYFKELYDLRQYHKNMDGCYMEIKKISS